MTAQFLGPLVRVWTERLRQAENAKLRFNKVGKTCNDFYESQRGFMWRDDNYFHGRMPRPRFAITIAKAYEFVSIYAPHLYWQNAARKVFSPRALKLTPELFGDSGDQEAQDVGSQIMAAEQQERSVIEFGNEMLELYLDWAQREQPNTLIQHGQHAIIDGLIKGMGCLWTKTYQFPDSPGVYTMQQYDTVDNLYIDPDCKDAMWESASYIMCRHVTPIWEVERIFNLPRNSLHGKGSHSSAEHVSRAHSSGDKIDPKTFDCLEWYEVWSKSGVGPRSHQLSHHMIDVLDQELGDNVYLAFAPGVPYPLNTPPEIFFGDNAVTPESLRPLFEWRCHGFGDPFPIYKDRKWPVEPLVFNPVPGSPWPLAPLAPGLGELIAINVITSSYVDSAWSNRQQVLAYVQSAVEEVKEVLDSDDAIAKVPLNDNLRGHINDAMQFLNRPNANTDQLQALEMLSSNFNRRVGLNELQYGETKTQIRVSGDVRAKQEALQIRPQKMAADVARFLTNASQKELVLAVMHIRGEHLRHLLGEWGAQQWDILFEQMDMDTLLRECRATVESSEIARPNKTRDTANIQSLQQYLMPLLQRFAQETGNTGPLNEFFEKIADAMDMSEPPAQLPDWRPPVDQQQEQIQQMSQQVQLEKEKAEAMFKQASAQKAIVDAGLGQARTQDTQVDTAIKVAEHAIPKQLLEEESHQSRIRREDEEHYQSLEHKQQDHALDLFFNAEKADAEIEHQRKLTASTNGSGE